VPALQPSALRGIRQGVRIIKAGQLNPDAERSFPNQDGPMPSRTQNKDKNGFVRSSVLSVSREQFHRISFTEWGRSGKLGPVICVHGLTRQARDFDFLAGRLGRRGYHVLCPDVVGSASATG
jgi:pimeloyl-ACP methyl ester carboxylesterase